MYEVGSALACATVIMKLHGETLLTSKGHSASWLTFSQSLLFTNYLWVGKDEKSLGGKGKRLKKILDFLGD